MTYNFLFLVLNLKLYISISSKRVSMRFIKWKRIDIHSHIVDDLDSKLKFRGKSNISSQTKQQQNCIHNNHLKERRRSNSD